MSHIAAPGRYDSMPYRRCGRSGILLPAISFGLWQNFGDASINDESRRVIFRAFDLGITHFDTANNYGPPYGSAESNFGKILHQDLGPYRDELIISTKAGYDMWPGPYGNWGSRKYLIASLDQSLKRLGLDYVDIFYSHRYDPETPLEETMGALADIVKQGKALYAGLSNYPAEKADEAIQILSDMGVHCLIDQPRYSMLERTAEKGLFSVLGKHGVGCIVFQVLAQGMLTGRYLEGVPEDSRLGRHLGSIKGESIESNLNRLRQLNNLAHDRGQTLAQMAIAWALRIPEVTSVLLGASTVSQIEENVAALNNLTFTPEELKIIDQLSKSHL